MDMTDWLGLLSLGELLTLAGVVTAILVFRRSVNRDRVDQATSATRMEEGLKSMGGKLDELADMNKSNQRSYTDFLRQLAGLEVKVNAQDKRLDVLEQKIQQ
jgi:outer membrane usher protein FimD/PapC